MSSSSPPARSRRRLLVAATAALVVVVVAAVLAVVFWNRPAGLGPRGQWPPSLVTPLASSMRAQPVPGWKASTADIGLPSGSADPVRFATGSDPFYSHPFIGNVGDDAYFVVGSPRRQWWVVGLDVHDGHRLFAPVELKAPTAEPKCFVNGPPALLCLSDDAHTTTAWVIDSRSGVVTYSGPTDLHTRPATLGVQQIGSYAVAATENQGVYGIGPRAQTTWFVPGDGSVDQHSFPPVDGPPSSLVTQSTPGRGSSGTVVFSPRDGHVVQPEIADTAQQQETVVYPGGFAAQIATSDLDRSLEFFDDNGRRVGRLSVDGTFVNVPTRLPIVGLSGTDKWAVFGPDGRPLLEDSGKPPQTTLFAGRWLFADRSTSVFERSWQQYDLQTGTAGKKCDIDFSYGYLGTDGTVGVFQNGSANTGLVTRAVDLATCRKLWTYTSPIGSFRHVWRVNTTLVQLSDDGTTLTSLVAPG